MNVFPRTVYSNPSLLCDILWYNASNAGNFLPILQINYLNLQSGITREVCVWLKFIRNKLLLVNSFEADILVSGNKFNTQNQ